jgi:hypothetical protein
MDQNLNSRFLRNDRMSTNNSIVYPTDNSINKLEKLLNVSWDTVLTGTSLWVEVMSEITVSGEGAVNGVSGLYKTYANTTLDIDFESKNCRWWYCKYSK